MMKVKTKRIDFTQVFRDSERATKSALKKAAKAAVVETVKAIATGKTPTGKAQKPNRRGSRPPLVDTGLLSNGAAWSVRAYKGGFEVIPPAGRRKAVVELKSQGFRLVEINEAMNRDLARFFSREVSR